MLMLMFFCYGSPSRWRAWSLERSGLLDLWGDTVGVTATGDPFISCIVPALLWVRTQRGGSILPSVQDQIRWVMGLFDMRSFLLNFNQLLPYECDVWLTDCHIQEATRKITLLKESPHAPKHNIMPSNFFLFQFVFEYFMKRSRFFKRPIFGRSSPMSNSMCPNVFYGWFWNLKGLIYCLYIFRTFLSILKFKIYRILIVIIFS